MKNFVAENRKLSRYNVKVMPHSLSPHRQRYADLNSPSLSDIGSKSAASNQSQEDQNMASPKKQIPFNATRYKFKKEDYNYEQEDYKRKFISHLGTDRLAINKQLVELVYFQVLSRFKKGEKSDGIPQGFMENKLKWAGLLMRTPKMQSVFADFTDQVALVLEQQFKGNEEVLADYVRYPHDAKKLSQSLSPDRSSLTELEKIWSPEKPKAKYKQTVFVKAREHIQKIQYKTKLKKAKDDIEEQKRLEEELRAQEARRLELDKMAIIGQVKNKAKEQEKEQERQREKNPLAQEVCERVEKIMDQIEDLKDNNHDLKQEIRYAERDLENCEHQNYGKNPGIAVKDLLKRWSVEPLETDKQIEQYANELWITREQFEKELRDEQRGAELEILKAKMNYQVKLDNMRSVCAFRIDALESALTEQKLKSAKQIEQSEMRLAEMESHLLSQHRTDEEIDATLDEAFMLLAPKKPGSEEAILADLMPDDKKIKILTNALRSMRESVRSMQQTRYKLEKRIGDLASKIELDQAFINKTQEEYRTSKELVLYYQVVLSEIIDQTNIFKPGSKASAEDRLMFQEILDLNRERKRLDREEKRYKLKPDPKTQLVRLSEFIDEVHDIMLALDVRQIFKKYCLVIQEKETIVSDLVGEMVKMGLIEESVLPQQVIEAYEKKAEDIRNREEELLKKLERQKSRPMKKMNSKSKTVSLEKQQSVEKKQDIAPKKSQTMRQQIDPEQQKMIQDMLIGISKPTDEGVLEAVEQERIAIAEGKQEPIEMTEMEAEFQELVGKMGSGALTKDPKMAEARKIFVEKIEATQHLRIEKERERSEAASRASSRATSRANLRAKSRATSRYSSQKDRAESRQQVKVNVSKERQSETVVTKQMSPHQSRGDLLTVSNTKTSRGNIQVSSLDKEEAQKQKSKSPSKKIEKTVKMDKKQASPPRPNSVKTELINLIGDALQDIDEKLRQKYSEEINQLDKSALKLTSDQFEKLYATFSESIGKKLRSEEYMKLFKQNRLPDFMQLLNTIQKSYSGSRSSVMVNKKNNQKEIQLSDCIQVDIDIQGNFKGLQIRSNIAKLTWVDNPKLTQRVIETVNYVNRLLFDDKEYKLIDKNDKKLEHEVTNEMTKNEGNVSSPWDIEHQNLFKILQDHALDIMARDKPQKKNYFKLDWKNQNLSELLEYTLKAVKVAKNPNETGDEFDLTFSEYLQHILSELSQKITNEGGGNLYVKSLFQSSPKSPGKKAPNSKKAQKKSTQIQLQSAEDKTSRPQSTDKQNNIPTPTILNDGRTFISIASQTEEEIPSKSSHNQRGSKSVRKSLAYEVQFFQQKKNVASKGIQTHKELLENHINRQIAKMDPSFKQIQDAMNFEMKRTIETLNTYVDKVKNKKTRKQILLGHETSVALPIETLPKVPMRTLTRASSPTTSIISDEQMQTDLLQLKAIHDEADLETQGATSYKTVDGIASQRTVDVASSPRVSIQVHSQELKFDQNHSQQPRRRPVHQKLNRKLPNLQSDGQQHDSRNYLSESARGHTFTNVTSSQQIEDGSKGQFEELQQQSMTLLGMTKAAVFKPANLGKPQNHFRHQKMSLQEIANFQSRRRRELFADQQSVEDLSVDKKKTKRATFFCSDDSKNNLLSSTAGFAKKHSQVHPARGLNLRINPIKEANLTSREVYGARMFIRQPQSKAMKVQSNEPPVTERYDPNSHVIPQATLCLPEKMTQSFGYSPGLGGRQVSTTLANQKD